MPSFLRGKQVDARCGFSASTRERLVIAGLFPQPVKPTYGTRAWVEEEIDAWIAERIAVRDNGTETTDPVIAATAGQRGCRSASNGSKSAATGRAPPSASPRPIGRPPGRRPTIAPAI